MKVWKKRISLILVIVLTFVLMAGCADGGAAPTTPTTPTAPTTPSSPTTPGSSGTAADPAADPAPNYPGNKTINVICPYGAGGGNDTTARLIAKYVPEFLGNMIVTNVTGGSGRVGTQQVMDSPADGYTLMFNDANTDMLYAQGLTDYGLLDAWEAFYIPAVAESASLQVTEWDTFDEMLEWARANPGELTFGIEFGTNTEMAACAFFNEFGIEGKLIDVGSTSDQLAALAGGHIKMIHIPVGTSKDYREAGQFKVMAFLLEERHPEFPDVPTLIEKGGPDWLYMPRYYYIGFPKGTDHGIIEKFGTALEKVATDQRFIDDMNAVQLTARFMGGADAKKYAEDTYQVWMKYAEAIEKFKAAQN